VVGSISVYNLANLLSLVRILLVPCFILFMAYHEADWALAAFLAASVTDYLDGLAARRLGISTQLGAFLDPLADKLLVVAAYVMLTLAGRLALWMTVAVITRDLLVVTGFVLLLLISGNQDIKPSWWGKAATFAQMVLLSLALWVKWETLTPDQVRWMKWAFVITVGATFVSGLDYLVKGILRFEESKKN
jgi:cardiolipin synthase